MKKARKGVKEISGQPADDDSGCPGRTMRELKPVLKAHGLFEFQERVETYLFLSAFIDVFHDFQRN